MFEGTDVVSRTMAGVLLAARRSGSLFTGLSGVNGFAEVLKVGA